MTVRTLFAAGVALSIAVLMAPAMAQDEAEDPVVGRVNGNEILQSEIVGAYEGLPAEYQQVPIEQLHPILLDRAIDDALIADQAGDLGYETDEEIQVRLEMARAQIYREVYFTRYVSEHLTEEMVRARYDEIAASTPRAEEVHARHILLETEEEARAVIERANQKGVDFAELAQEKSIGPSGPLGGDLGYFTQDRMVPAFGEAAFGMQPGEVSAEPVETEFGWHVIKVEDRRTAAAPPFEAMRGEIMEQMAQEVIAEGIIELRRGAEIEKLDFAGSPVVDPIDESPDAQTNQE